MASRAVATSLLLIISIVNFVKTNDIRLGLSGPNSKKIYSEIKEQDPALWKRSDDIIINAVGQEVISSISVTDLRDDKDGEAFIESGGIGQKSVTIGLRSPSILRGYRFAIEVFGQDPNANYYHKGASYEANANPSRVYTKGGSDSYIDNGQFARKF